MPLWLLLAAGLAADTARSVQCCRLRNPIATAHQENLKQLGSLIRIDHATLQQIVSQRRQLRHRESVFVVRHFLVRHGRHHLRFRPIYPIRLIGSCSSCMQLNCRLYPKVSGPTLKSHYLL